MVKAFVNRIFIHSEGSTKASLWLMVWSGAHWGREVH